MRGNHQKLARLFSVSLILLLFLEVFIHANQFVILGVETNSMNEFFDGFENLENWEVKKGVWLVEESTLKASGAGSNRWIHLKTFNATNFELEVKLKFMTASGTQWFGVVVRLLDDSSYLWAFLYRDHSGGFSRLYLRYVQGGNLAKNLFTNNLSQNFTSNTWYTLQLSMVGTHVKFVVPQISDAIFETDMAVSAYTGFGLMVTGNEGEFYFDNLTITSHLLTDSFDVAKKAASFLGDVAMINDLRNTNYGGIRGMLRSDGTWFAPGGYTETTGYEIQSLVNFYKVDGNASYLRAITAACDWEINVCQYMGTDAKGYGGIRSTDPNATSLTAWHTATVMAGLVEAWKLSGNETYLNRTKIGMDFIVRANDDQQKIQGAGLVGTHVLGTGYYSSDYLATSAGGQANFMLSVYEFIQNQTYLQYAKKNLDVLVSSQLPNGTWWRFIYNNGTALPAGYSGQQIENYAHYIMYIAQGMISGYRITGNITYLEAAKKAWNYVAIYLRHGDGIIGYRKAEVAQFGLVSKMLYDITENSTYLNYANQQMNTLANIQGEDGGFPNDDLSKETWANKFAIDFILNMLDLDEIAEPHLVYVSSRIYNVAQSFANQRLTITIAAPPATTYTLKVYTADKGKPFSLFVNGINKSEGYWAYDNFSNIVTVTWTHSESDTEIVLAFDHNPIISQFEAPLIVYANKYFYLNATIQDFDGIADFINTTVEISNNVILKWDNASNIFSKYNDPNNYCTLNSNLSLRVSVNATAYKLCWRIKLTWTYPESSINIVAANTAVYDAKGSSGYASYSGLFTFEDDLIVYAANANDERINPNQNINFKGTLYYHGTITPPEDSNGITVKISLGATIKATNTTVDSDGNFFISLNGESNVASYSYTVFATTDENSVQNQTIQIIVDKLNITFAASKTDPALGETVTISWAILRQYDNSPVSSFTVSINRNDTSWKSKLTTNTATDTQSTANTYTYDVYLTSVTDITYDLTEFNSTPITVSWSAHSPTPAIIDERIIAAALIISLAVVTIGIKRAQYSRLKNRKNKENKLIKGQPKKRITNS